MRSGPAVSRLLLTLACLCAWSGVSTVAWSGPIEDAFEERLAADPAPHAPVRGEAKSEREAKPEREGPAERSFFAWMIRSSGVFGFLILLVSFALAALILMIGLQLQRDYYLPAALVEQLEQKLSARDYQGAYEMARSSDSFIGRLLAAGMSRLRDGYAASQTAMQEVGDDEAMAMEHKLGYLSLIGSVAPMLGLLGTVQGMMLGFQAMAISVTPLKPYQLADGIATALFTTMEGLVVAIPAMFFCAFYKNRLARFLMESGYLVDNLMGRFQHTSQPPATIPAPRLAGGAPIASAAAPEA